MHVWARVGSTVFIYVWVFIPPGYGVAMGVTPLLFSVESSSHQAHSVTIDITDA